MSECQPPQMDECLGKPELNVPASEALNVIGIPMAAGGGVSEPITPLPAKALEFERKNVLVWQHQQMVLKQQRVQLHKHLL